MGLPNNVPIVDTYDGDVFDEDTVVLEPSQPIDLKAFTEVEEKFFAQADDAEEMALTPYADQSIGAKLQGVLNSGLAKVENVGEKVESLVSSGKAVKEDIEAVGAGVVALCSGFGKRIAKVLESVETEVASQTSAIRETLRSFFEKEEGFDDFENDFFIRGNGSVDDARIRMNKKWGTEMGVHKASYHEKSKDNIEDERAAA